uniref:Uncharacterized protein n=1 Tax=Romanomermis culicivorax TaxID=13658 RepID=A0A915IAT5_ROMCU
SVGIPGGGPWAIKRARGPGVPSVSRYDAITLTWPVVSRVVDGFTLTGVASFGGGGGKADDGVGAETTAAAGKPMTELKDSKALGVDINKRAMHYKLLKQIGFLVSFAIEMDFQVERFKLLAIRFLENGKCSRKNFGLECIS